MSFAYLPMFTGDYLRDTRHLTPLKHGIYLLLLFHCWDTRGPAPLDEQECSGIANCRSADEIEALRYVLARFFVRMEDGHYNKRMQTEIERSENISRARAEAGRKGYQAFAKHLPGKSTASASIPIPIPIPSPSPGTTKTKGVVGLKPDMDAAKRVLECLNRNAGRKYHPVEANLKPIVARLREGYTESELRAITAVKARQWKRDDRMDAYLRPKTIFNATNAAQYRAELPTNQIEETDA